MATRPGPAGSGSVDRPPAPPEVDRLFPQVERLYQYVDLLISVGVERGLLGPREVTGIYPRHILNCAVVAPAIPEGARLCDLGSGAGLPGLVLALARPDLEVTLLEPMQRRVTFLEEAVVGLGLDRVSVLRARAGAIEGDFDVVAARAVAPLGRLIEWAVPLLRPGGDLLALKGERAEQEVASAAPVVARLRLTAPRIERYGEGTVVPLATVVRVSRVG